MPSVKIAIDIRRMTEFGVGTYIRNVVRTLGRLDHENEYLLIGSPAKVEEIGSLPPNFHAVPLVAPENTPAGIPRVSRRSAAADLRPGSHPQSFFDSADAALPLCHDRA
jgi:hypothetical protein